MPNRDPFDKGINTSYTSRLDTSIKAKGMDDTTLYEMLDYSLTEGKNGGYNNNKGVQEKQSIAQNIPKKYPQKKGSTEMASSSSTTSPLRAIFSLPSEKDKQEAETLHSLGYEARRNGEYRKAIEYYTKSIEKNPKHFKAYFNRGFAYDKLKEYEKAIEDYSKALEVEPKNGYIYYNRGISLDRMGRYDEAIYNFSMAITLVPSNADFYHNRGFALRKKLDFEKAISDYSKAIELNPKHFKVR